jgi:hypothetical protein
MKTLGLQEAAALLLMAPQTLQIKAASGLIPAVKAAKCWVFIDVDLFEWLRSQYSINRQDVPEEEVKCSLREKRSGITDSESKESQYTNLLAPATKKKPEQSKHRLM